jgi:DNA-binding GntR family transcriptional regulator
MPEFSVDGSTVVPPLFRKTALTDEVYEYLKSRIMEDTLEPDTPLRIEVIARSIGVSPTPVREAMLRLEADALVSKRGTRGYFTNPIINRDEFSDLWDFRLVVEPWAAARAAERSSDSDLARIVNETDFPAGSGKSMDFSSYRLMQEHDHRFHELIFTLAGNDNAAAAFSRTHAHLRTFRIHFAAQMGDTGLREHAAIAKAIATRDPEGSALAMRRHLEASRERLLPFVPSPPPLQ